MVQINIKGVVLFDDLVKSVHKTSWPWDMIFFFLRRAGKREGEDNSLTLFHFSYSHCSTQDSYCFLR